MSSTRLRQLICRMLGHRVVTITHPAFSGLHVVCCPRCGSGVPTSAVSVAGLAQLMNVVQTSLEGES